jgi:hypothetical protein
MAPSFATPGPARRRPARPSRMIASVRRAHPDLDRHGAGSGQPDPGAGRSRAGDGSAPSGTAGIDVRLQYLPMTSHNKAWPSPILAQARPGADCR